MVPMANVSPAIPVVDREDPRPWSPGPVFAALERALDLEDLEWCEPDFRPQLRRNRRHVVSCCVQELRQGTRFIMDEWRTHAAARGDFSGPDPVLQMLALRALLLGVECLATWTLTWGQPQPRLARLGLLRLRHLTVSGRLVPA
jgi:hypothetical protein